MTIASDGPVPQQLVSFPGVPSSSTYWYADLPLVRFPRSVWWMPASLSADVLAHVISAGYRCRPVPAFPPHPAPLRNQPTFPIAAFCLSFTRACHLTLFAPDLPKAVLILPAHSTELNRPPQVIPSDNALLYIALCCSMNIGSVASSLGRSCIFTSSSHTPYSLFCGSTVIPSATGTQALRPLGFALGIHPILQELDN